MAFFNFAKTTYANMTFVKLPFKLFLFFSGLSALAQKPTDVLVTINDSIYNVADFERLYNKNIDMVADASQKDIANYFNLYKTYKLKLQNAYSLEIDKTQKVTQEYKSYRNQLAEKYFVNDDDLERLLNEAFDRNEYEVKASHILFAVDEFAQPQDTLKAYNKAIEVRNELMKNLSFEEAALKYSDDLSAKKNKGNLGYFSIFKMVYLFENGVYNTPVGSVSMPIRSDYGYHLIKVVNKRPTQKIKTIAHILIEAKDKNDAAAKKKINDIYKRLQTGENFYDAAFHLSEDILSRDKGGDLGIYTEGNFNIDGISDVVYELNFKGAYSQPFFSQYGWHIVAVTNIQDKPSREDLRENFTRKIKSDTRSKVLDKNLITHLKEMYHFSANENNILEAAKLLEREEMINQPKVESSPKTEAVLATYADKKITAKNVLEHIYSFPKEYAFLKTNELVLQKAFDFYSLRKLKEQYNNDLETKYPEFAHTLSEYKEGLVLFDLLEQKIWKMASEDTLAQQKYFIDHKEHYKQPGYFIGEVYVFKSKRDAKTYHKLLKINYNVKEEDFPMLYKYQGRFYLDDKRLPANLELNTIGKNVVKHNNNYYVFFVRERKEAVQPTYDDVKSRVLSDYQVEYEKEYSNELLKNAKINVNEAVLNQLKAKYNKKNLNKN